MFTPFGATFNSTGGNWLQINPNSFGCCGINTPQQMIVSVAPASALAVGTYTGEIILTASAGSPSMVIPVTLRVNTAATTAFDDMPGGIGFLQVTGGANPAAQSIPIRNAGSGTLDWTAAASTSDGASWLSLSSSSGTAPSSLTVSIKSANLPGKGLVAGIFNGQIVLTTGGIRQTIPVQAVVGAKVFEPVAPLSFTKPYDGANPTYQVMNVNSTGATLGFYGQAADAVGGNWLVINPDSFGCCGASTPEPIQVSIAPATTLVAGSYVGEIIITSNAGDQGFVVPVTMTIDGTAAAAKPLFSPAAGTYDAPQTVTITDSTRGSAIHYTITPAGKTPVAPSVNSPVYTGPIAVSASETIETLIVAPGYGTTTTSAVYTITAPTTPEPSASQVLTLTDATTGAKLYYTINGAAPTTSSTLYTTPITISGTGTTTIQVMAVAPGDAQSAVRTITITVK